MDGVELVMAFEEEFGISIPDSAAAEMFTPRQVIDFVIAERRRAAPMDAHAHVVRVLTEMGYSGVSPATAFNELFAKKGRVSEWRELGKKLAPFSAPPARTRNSGCILAIIGLIAMAAGLFLQQWLLAGAGVLLIGADVLWARLSRSIPGQTDTLQKLVEHLTRPVSAEEVAAKVKSIVLEQLGLPESKYGEDKRFVEDFGID